jgi:hypothetical protein
MHIMQPASAIYITGENADQLASLRPDDVALLCLLLLSH